MTRNQELLLRAMLDGILPRTEAYWLVGPCRSHSRRAIQIDRMLDRMHDRGLCRRLRGGYEITDEGRKALSEVPAS